MRGGTQQQMAADEEKMSEVKKLLTCGAFYFSWSSNPSVAALDLTLSAQKAAQAGAAAGSGTNDNRFFWWATQHMISKSLRTYPVLGSCLINLPKIINQIMA